jgi:sulfotransferase
MIEEGKQYNFLAGLPRSGNTLLAAILNQNPQTYCSPLSPIINMLWNHNSLSMENESAIRLENKEPLTSVGESIIKNYYQNIDKPIIIDREKAWATTANLDIIKKYITPTPKIIFTMRPILEILASWISILPEESFIDIEMQNNNWWYKDYLSLNDNRCDYLMRPHGQIDKVLFSINEILKLENKNMFCLVQYNDLINTPQDAMDKIYNFLEVPNYKHDFNKIKKLEKDNDEALGHPSNLHEIRPQLKKTSKDPKEILSEYVISKYSNIGYDLL